jgi:hypothetical protein
MHQYIRNNLANPNSEKFWGLTYKDDDAMTCNPGLLVSAWSVVREIEKITMQMRAERRNVRICTTKSYERIEDVPQAEDEMKCFHEMGYSRDLLLMW